MLTTVIRPQPQGTRAAEQPSRIATMAIRRYTVSRPFHQPSDAPFQRCLSPYNPILTVHIQKPISLDMSGNLCVGRVYKRDFTRITQWFWAINGVQHAPADVMRLAGVRSSFLSSC